MSFVSLANLAGGAPGTYLTERTAGANFPQVASFNTTYMLVEVPNLVSSITFPFFTPVQVVDLNDYINRIGGVVPTNGPTLTSYNSVKAYFRNSGNGILKVVRIGSPSKVVRVEFPVSSMLKVDSTGANSALATGDAVHLRFEFNGFPLGNISATGQYQGIRYTVSAPPTSAEARAAISKEMRDALVREILRDDVVSSFVYVRQVSNVALNGETHWVELTPRIYGQTLNVYASDEPIPAGVYSAQGSVITDRPVGDGAALADYIQTVQTSFRPSMDQGYLIAPSGFMKFAQPERVSLGSAMEALAADANYLWTALVDPGSANVNDMAAYSAVGRLQLDVDGRGYAPNAMFKQDGTIWRATQALTLPAEVNDLGDLGALAGTPVITSPGAGYTARAYTNVPVTGNGGSGGQATVVVAPGGRVASVSITAAGTGYSSGTGLTIAASQLGGASGATDVTINAVVTGGALTTGTATIVNSGNNLAPRPYQAVAVQGGSGTGATVDVVVAPDGSVAAITIVAAGTGYRVGEVLTVAAISLGNASGGGLSFTASTLDATLNTTVGSEVLLRPSIGNRWLANGLYVNGQRYSVPVIVRNVSGTAFQLPVTDPASAQEVEVMQMALTDGVIQGHIQLVDGSAKLDQWLRTGRVVAVDQALTEHHKLLQDCLKHTTANGFLAYFAPYMIDLEGYAVPPSAFVAGIAARRYFAEGFQNPPAGVNYAVNGVLEPQIEISRQQQQASNPRGLNAIRTLEGYGVRVWGARTRSASPYYQWINVRVILNVIEGTLRTAFDNLIFSANDGERAIFIRARQTAEAILYRFWQGGALFGSEPRQAYYVEVSRRNNPSWDIESGLTRITCYVSPTPTLERIQIDVVRVLAGQIDNALQELG